MPPSFVLVRITFLQLKRLLSGLGPVYLLLLTGMVSYMLLMLGGAVQQPANAFLFVGAAAFAVLAIQAGRSDRAFVFTHLEQPSRSLAVQYWVFVLPVALPLLLGGQWYLFPVLALLLWGISYVKAPFLAKSSRFGFSKWVSPHRFEWVGGLRQQFYPLLALYLLALGTSWLPIVPLLALWLLTSAIVPFFQVCEPRHLLYARAVTAKKFLAGKVLGNTAPLLVLFLPVLAINAFFCPELIWAGAAAAVLLCVLPVFAILLKYANYVPNEQLRQHSLLLSLVSLGVVFPFFAPLPLVMCAVYYGRALKAMKPFFDD